MDDFRSGSQLVGQCAATSVGKTVRGTDEQHHHQTLDTAIPASSVAH